MDTRPALAAVYHLGNFVFIESEPYAEVVMRGNQGAAELPESAWLSLCGDRRLVEARTEIEADT